MASKFVMPTRMVLVEWIDAASVVSGTWKTWKKLHKDAGPATIMSMGYVAKDEPDYIVIVSSLCIEDGTNDGDVTILKINIKKMWDLNAVEQAK